MKRWIFLLWAAAVVLIALWNMWANKIVKVLPALSAVSESFR